MGGKKIKSEVRGLAKIPEQMWQGQAREREGRMEQLWMESGPLYLTFHTW